MLAKHSGVIWNGWMQRSCVPSKPAIANGLDKCTIFKTNPDAPLSPELSLETVDDAP